MFCKGNSTWVHPMDNNEYLFELSIVRKEQGCMLQTTRSTSKEMIRFAPLGALNSKICSGDEQKDS